MSIYRKIAVKMWSDESFRRLSPSQPCGQSLWIWLLTGPFSTVIPGCIPIGPSTMSAHLRWEPKAFGEAFREVFQEGLIEADENAGFVWIKNALAHNMPASPNVVTSWKNSWELIPECDLKNRVWQANYSYLKAFGEAFGEAFAKACRKPSAKPLAKAMANQDQDQDQEQDQEKKKKIHLHSLFEKNSNETPNEEITQQQKAKSYGCRIPDDFAMTPEMREYATSKGVWNPEGEFETFKNYWQAKSGAGARKADWVKTWQVWCARAGKGATNGISERARRGYIAPLPSKPDDIF